MSRLGANQPTPVVRRRCINCSFMIPLNQHVHSLQQASNPIITLLQSWITPTQLSSESILCTECMVLLQDRVNTLSEICALPLPAFGHRSICFPCGQSILRATRTYPVRHDHQERNILMRNIPLHSISRMERVCAACWRAAYREVQRQNRHDSNRPALPDIGSSGDFSIPMPPPLPQQNWQTSPISAKITSSVYRRAANTANHCIFVDCLESERLLVPSSIKDLLLLCPDK